MRILVVGDVMLDHNRYCRSQRQCAEAPVPVLVPDRDEDHLGGAAAVARMCRALGATVSLCGVTGEDDGRLLRLMQLDGIEWLGCRTARPTTVKERIYQGTSLIARIDYESTESISADDVLRLFQNLRNERPDIIIVSDYAKGVCVEPLVRSLAKLDAPVIVDPPRGLPWTKYRGVDCLTPNLTEAADRTARQIRRELSAKACIVTQGERGCTLDTAKGTRHLRARPADLADVTGAGDQFIATLAVQRAVGLDWIEAAAVANVAAGLQVERHGCIPITFEGIRNALEPAFASTRAR